MNKPKDELKRIFGVAPFGVIASAVIFAIALWADYFLDITKMNATISFALAVVFFTLFVVMVFYILMSLPVSKRGTAVIRRGIYGKIRHPLYSAGVFLFYPAVAFFTKSWIVLITTPVVFRIFSIVARIEEVYMIRLFRDEYKQYMEEVGGFFPKIFSKSSNPKKEE